MSEYIHVEDTLKKGNPKIACLMTITTESKAYSFVLKDERTAYREIERCAELYESYQQYRERVCKLKG